jgi:hypothetical protein
MMVEAFGQPQRISPEEMIRQGEIISRERRGQLATAGMGSDAFAREWCRNALDARDV